MNYPTGTNPHWAILIRTGRIPMLPRVTQGWWDLFTYHSPLVLILRPNLVWLMIKK
jgi:hypothetical protein